MKKLLLFSICIALSCSIGVAQSNSSLPPKHLSFRDIPIDGNITNFVNKLKNSGFSLIKLNGNSATMTGKFTGKDCEIFVTASTKTNTVYKVSVYLPKETSWYSAKSTYQSYKEQYQQKYGVPTNSYEFFSTPYYEGDGYELQAVRLEKCTYFTYWELELGNIAVEISEFEQIKLSYEDKLNINIARKEKEENVQNEI